MSFWHRSGLHKKLKGVFWGTDLGAGVQGGAHPRGDQGVAVHHPHEAHLLDRLSGGGVPSYRRQGVRHRSEGRYSRGKLGEGLN